MEIGLSTNGGKLIEAELFENYSKSGIKFMEISLPQEDYMTFDYKNAKKLADEYGISLWSFHLPFKPFNTMDISSLDNELRKNSVACTAELIKKAADIGIDKYVIHCGGLVNRNNPHEVRERISYAKESYALLAEYAAREGGTVLVENLPPVSAGTNIEEIDELVSADERLGICFDTNHLLDGNHVEFINHFGTRIISTHISDYDLIKERHWLPGEGNLDWKMLYKALRDAGYTGPWLYEVAFVNLPTINRGRDLICEDFARNAHEIFENREFTIIPSVKNV